jgi:hypothetical protein
MADAPPPPQVCELGSGTGERIVNISQWKWNARRPPAMLGPQWNRFPKSTCRLIFVKLCEIHWHVTHLSDIFVPAKQL